jgi:hypothetical protein
VGPLGGKQDFQFYPSGPSQHSSCNFPVHPYIVQSLLIHYHIIFSLILYTFKCAVVGKINNLSFFLSFIRVQNDFVLEGVMVT